MKSRLALTTPLRQSLLSLIKVTAVAVALFTALGLYWVSLLADQDNKTWVLERETRLRSAQLTQTLALQMQALFSGLDFVAQNLVAEYALGSASGFDLAVQTATSTYPQRSILQISVVDSEGQVVYSNLQKSPRSASTTSIRDRAHFLFHANSATSGLYISQPVMGRVSNLWTIQITRAIREQGRFRGVVVISIAPSYLSNTFREILEQPGDVITLIRDDGAYLARSRDEEVVLGKFVSEEHNFVHQPKSVTSGYYDTETPFDGIKRHFAWHRVGSLPLVVGLGLDKDAVLKPLLEDIHVSRVRNAIGSAMVLAAALLIGWLALQQRRSKAQATRSEELLRKLVTQVPGGLFQLRAYPDGSLKFPYATPSLYKLHHTPPDAVAGDAEIVFRRVHPDDALRIRQELHKAASQLISWQGRYRVKSDDGELHWMLATAMPEHCDDGSVLWHGYVQDVTQEHEMQQALRTSEQHLRLTMDAVHDGLWQWDLATNNVHWDARCWEMLGYPAQAAQLSGYNMMEWMHPSDRERFQRRVTAHLERGEHYHCEFRLRKASGGWLWVEARGNVTDTDAGKPLRMLGTHTDISERVAQGQLRRALLDESAAAIFLATPDRLIEHANRRAYSMFGRGNASLSGQSMRIIHPDDESFAQFAECYVELRAQGWASRELVLQLGDGSLRRCDIHGTLLDPNEPLGQVIWTVMDAEARYRALSELRIAQQRLTAIVERFPGGVMLQERLYGPIVAMNLELAQLLGLPKPTDHLPAELEAKVRALLPSDMLMEPELSAPGTAPPVNTVEQQIPDGRFFEVLRVPLWEGDRSIGLLWMLRDISERKRRESKLEQLAATDTLTGLPNRRSFMARLQQEFDDIRRGEASPAVVAMLDIDFFKRFNDTWGHAGGDEVLKHLTTLLRQSLRLRNGDMAGRIGGEEFAILLASTDLQGGMQLAERLRELIASTPAHIDQGQVAFTASIGVSVLGPDATSIDAALERADAALYHAKRHGRNQVCAWQADLEDDAAPG